MQAVILAGGLGTRLRPLTYEIPKPMIPILGKPYLYYQLKLLKDYCISDVLLLIGHLGEQIKDYFKDGKEFGLDIKYSIEQKPLGTGGALKLAEPLLKDEFFVIYGDSYLPVDYIDIERFFQKHNKTGLVVVYDNKEDTTVLNNIALKENLIVTEYKKGYNDRNLKYVEAGVSLLRKDVLNLIKEEDVVSLEEEIYPLLIGKQELIAYITNQRFYDIGTPERLKEIKDVLR